nr:hypothetical protein [Tanacetum cinerariifolium]
MGERNWNSHRSKEDLTQKISKSIFVTNFPDHISVRDLWGTCKAYGTVADMYITYKKSKAVIIFKRILFDTKENVKLMIPKILLRGMWGFLVLKSGKPVTEATGREVPSLVLDDTCFSNRDFNLSLMGKVKDITSLPNLYVILVEEGFQNFKISYLGGMWVLIELESSTASQKFIKYAGVGSWFSSLQPTSNSFVSDKRIVWISISIEGLPLKVWSFNTFMKVASKWSELVEWKNIKDNNFSRKQLCVKTKLNEIICERFNVIIQGNVHWVRAKEMDGWDPLLHNEDYASSSSDEENEQENEGS